MPAVVKGWSGGQDKGVGEILAVLDQAATGISPDERPIGRRHGCFLKVTQGYAALRPSVDPQGRSLDEAEEGLVDGHIASWVFSRVDDQARGHSLYDGNNLGGGQELP